MKRANKFPVSSVRESIRKDIPKLFWLLVCSPSKTRRRTLRKIEAIDPLLGAALKVGVEAMLAMLPRPNMSKRM